MSGTKSLIMYTAIDHIHRQSSVTRHAKRAARLTVRERVNLDIGLDVLVDPLQASERVNTWVIPIQTESASSLPVPSHPHNRQQGDQRTINVHSA